MNTNITELEAVEIANQYRIQNQNRLEGKALKYEFINVIYCCYSNIFSEKPVWEIKYDVQNWDDIWYKIIISDTEKRVICCSNMWNEKYFPHMNLK